MEEKKYEAGRVEISSAEYRDLVTEAVKAREEASQCRSEKWKLESEKKKAEEELAVVRKELDAIKKSYKQLCINLGHPEFNACLGDLHCNVAEVDIHG